jgi:hypothetical protein
MPNVTKRIYYTGDMANHSGWFAVTPAHNGNLRLIEEDGGEGRDFIIGAYQVGDVYKGHCNPRFVTEAAYRAYRDEQMARLTEFATRYA